MFPFKEFDSCVITNIYGKPGNYVSGKHEGIDIVCRGKSKIVYAVSSGVCIRSGWDKEWGSYVVIQMSNGKSIVYAHLVRGSRKVEVSDYVKVGDPIGKMGNTGNSKNAHLHIELQSDYYSPGRTENIASFLNIKNEIGQVKWNDVKNLEVICDGKIIKVAAVNINGDNFIKLQDLGKVADVDVDVNGRMPVINKKK